jgi:hypothetical protein
MIYEKQKDFSFRKEKRSENRRTTVEEGDWKIPQDAGPTRKAPPRHAEVKSSSFINTGL